jgi:hypothetical protein
VKVLELQEMWVTLVSNVSLGYMSEGCICTWAAEEKSVDICRK